MLEVNPQLSPQLIRDCLTQTAHLVSDVSREKQGYGVLQSGCAVAAASQEHHGYESLVSPIINNRSIQFMLHDHQAQSVNVYGSWDDWTNPLVTSEIEEGIWVAVLEDIQPQDIQYKFMLDHQQWLDDPLNPKKIHDAFGGLNSLITIDQF